MKHLYNTFATKHPYYPPQQYGSGYGQPMRPPYPGYGPSPSYPQQYSQGPQPAYYVPPGSSAVGYPPRPGSVPDGVFPSHSLTPEQEKSKIIEDIKKACKKSALNFRSES